MLLCMALITVSKISLPNTQNIIYIIPDDNACLDNVLFDKYVVWNVIKKNLYDKKGYIVKTPSVQEKDAELPYYYNFSDKDAIKYIIDLSPGAFFTLNYVDQFLHKIVLFLWEPPVVAAHLYDTLLHKKLSKIFTWVDDLVDGKKYFKIYYPVYFHWNFDVVALKSFDDKKLCTLINADKESPHPLELYSARREAINFFEQHHTDDFDFYGFLWPTNVYKNYRGTVMCPRECLKKYRFCICYENMRDTRGYITEKLFNCFIGYCVPVYWGASNITDYVPEGCFIDKRKFNDYETLYQYLKRMPAAEYVRYLENIVQFLQSPAALKFTPESVWQCVEISLLAEE
jgi:alpha(1,3/1,4) fucosyltransferase